MNKLKLKINRIKKFLNDLKIKRREKSKIKKIGTFAYLCIMAGLGIKYCGGGYDTPIGIIGAPYFILGG